ncbi:sensor histidine kinase KdpD [Picosynechococcus sp. NKBG042902]|uniref:sensor histidine kinase n=1 Tax=Picosynechococcus sp. NKBG042902 TaxID=490193 RepID=UPI000694DF8C|nr:histidine kinase dimerization/phospho-acceptor domain-containing protein [Picosynechococcus sp. NKBG042902]
MSNGLSALNTDLAIALQWGQFQARFFGQVAHELRSPLSTIMGLQQLILSDLCESPAEERAFIAESYAASQKLLGLLDLAIAVSKLDYGQSSKQAEWFDLEMLLAELESLLSVKAQNNNLRLTIAHPVGATLDIFGDRHHLHQFFLTLIDTTLQRAEQGTIHLSYGLQQPNKITFQLTSTQTTDFWCETHVPDLTLGDRPSLEEVQQLAQALEFSPALKWQLCKKLLASYGGTLTRHYQDHTMQVMGQFPQPHR